MTDGLLTHIKFTPIGEVPVAKEGNQLVEKPVPVPEFTKGMLTGIKPKHVMAFRLLMYGINEVLNKPKRHLPLTRQEYIGLGGDKSTLQELCDLGIVKEALIPVVDINGKRMGARAVVYYTLLGRSYANYLQGELDNGHKENH